MLPKFISHDFSLLKNNNLFKQEEKKYLLFIIKS